MPSAIEGEALDCDSVQSSIRRQLGLKADRRAGPAEAGIAEMTVDLTRRLTTPLDHATLFSWHRMVMNGRCDRGDLGCYRRHEEPMQIVSRPIHRQRVHFEAPSSLRVESEMNRFLDWLKQAAPGGSRSLPALTRAGIAHVWFESIHPFEDGNGRIGRAVVAKALAQSLSRPTLTGVAGTFLKRRKEYYQALENASRGLDVTEWLLWFAGAVIEAQRRAEAQITCILDKAKLLTRFEGRMNSRQEKAALRMVEAGPQGFVGGLSAGVYMRITGAPSATATRDLADLVAKGALTRTDERKATRYHLAVPLRPVKRVPVEEIS